MQSNKETCSRHRWPQTLSDMCDFFESYFRNRGQDNEQAAREAKGVVIELSRFFGGQEFYFPKGIRLKLAFRDREIYQQFNGRNYDELAKQYDLTNARIRDILKEQKIINKPKPKPAKKEAKK